MSLRDEAITHMAQAVANADRVGLDYGSEATAALDALLDFLQANREAWTEASLHPGTHEALVVIRRIAAGRLVAALWGTTEEL